MPTPAPEPAKRPRKFAAAPWKVLPFSLESTASICSRGRLQKLSRSSLGGISYGQPRQHQTLAGHGGVHSLHAVDDLSGLVDENEVGIAPHDLHGKGQLHNIPQLVDTGEVEIQHTFQPVLPDIQELAVSQPFPQEHTEHGRRFRIFDSDLGEVNSRPVAAQENSTFAPPVRPAKGNDQSSVWAGEFFQCVRRSAAEVPAALRVNMHRLMPCWFHPFLWRVATDLTPQFQL